jgi:uncharacterized protein YndB with AHSA1/START domain
MQIRAEGGIVEREVRIKARPETIFPFFTDPDKMVKWMGIEVTLEPWPGGVYYCNITGPNRARGAFVAIEPPHRVVYTFGWEGEGQSVPPGSSTVEVTLTTDGDHTIVRLRHSGLPVETGGSHVEGWEHYLDRLAAASEGRDLGPDPWVAAPATAG